MNNAAATQTTSPSGTVTLGNELTVRRLGFGAMRITGDGIWGPPKDPASSLAVLRRAVALGVNFISACALPQRSCDRDQGRMESPRAGPMDP